MNNFTSENWGFNFGDVSKALDIVKETGVSFAGKSQNWGSAEEVKTLVEEIEKCKELTYLNLEGNTLGVEAAKSIAEALKKHPEFKKALWKDLFTGRLKTEIPKALEYLGKGMNAAGTNLTVLDCSDNALGPNGMTGLVDLLRSPTCYSLQELKFNNCGLGIGGGRMLAQALHDCHKKSVEAGTPFMLKVFIAGRNRLENEGAKALAKVFSIVGTLEEIAMPQNGIYHEGISALSEAFKNNMNMRILNLNDNTLRERGAAALADAFFSMQKLREINLGDCLVKTEGALSIADSLQDGHTDLEILNLSFNEIGPDGGLSIAAALENKKNIRNVFIDGNHFGYDARERIKEIMQEYGNPEALGSLSEDESEGDEEDNESDDENDRDTEQEYSNEHHDDKTDDDDDDNDVNYITAISDKSLNSTVEQSLDSSSICIIGEESRPNTIETFCNTPNPSIKMFNDLEETDKLEAFKNYLENFKDENYLICLIFTILKCSAIAEESKEAKEIAIKLYKDVFDYAQKTNQMTRVKNFFLIQLGLLKCEDKKFKPAYNLKACRFVMKEAISQNSFPDDVKNSFSLFLERFA